MEYYRASAQGAKTIPVKKRKKRKTRRTLVFTAIVSLIGVMLVALYLIIFRDRDTVLTLNQTDIPVGVTMLNTGSGMLYQSADAATGKGILGFYSWTKVSNNYQKSFEAEDLKMNGSSGLSVVYTPTVLQIIGGGDPIGFTGELLSAECGTEHIAVLRRSGSGSESLLILNKSGEQVDQIQGDDQYIVDFGFYTTSGEMLYVETLSTTAGVPTVSITTYDLAKRNTTGVIQVQDQLVDGIYFTENSIFVAGTNQIIRYSHMGNEEAYREQIYGYRVLDFSSASGSPTFLLTSRQGDMHAVKLLTLSETDVSGATESLLQLPQEGVGANIMNGALVVAMSDRVFTYSLKGKLSSTALMKQTVTSAKKVTDHLMLMESDGLYYTVSVR